MKTMKKSWKETIVKVINLPDVQAICWGLLGAAFVGFITIVISGGDFEKNTYMAENTMASITSEVTTVTDNTTSVTEQTTPIVTTTSISEESTTATSVPQTTESEMVSEEPLADSSIDIISTEAPPVEEEIYYEPETEPIPVEPEPQPPADVDAPPQEEENTIPVYSDRPYIPDCTLSEDLQNYIYETCNNYGVDYCYIMAIIRIESNFNTTASNGSCYGLMQLNTYYNSGTADALGVSLWDPYGNVTVGIHHVADLLSRYGYSDALICYNYGEWGAQDYLGGSTEYSRTVMSQYYTYLG